MSVTDNPYLQAPFQEPDANGSIAGKLDVIREEPLEEQGLGWSFYYELLEDVMNMRDETINGLRTCMEKNDHVEFHKTAHALKGAALNLHLPGLIEVTRQAEHIGKELAKNPPEDIAGPLAARREFLIKDLETEYSRLEDYIPLAKEKAEQEGDMEGLDQDDGQY